MTNITAVLFDLDRTLLDRDAALVAYAHWLWQNFRTSSPEDETRFVNRFVELDARGRSDKHVYFPMIRAEFKLSCAIQPMLDRFENLFPSTVQPYPGAVPLLRDLVATGVACGVVTNGHSKGQREKITRSGFASFLKTVVISREVGLEKPDPAIFELALSAISRTAGETLFVGDSEVADVAGAQTAGMRAVLRRHPGQPVAPTRADFEIEQLNELPAVISACNQANAAAQVEAGASR